MPENNENSFFMLKGLNTAMQKRRATKEAEASAGRSILDELSNVVEINVSRVQTAQIEDEIPPFIVNHYKDRGQAVPAEITGDTDVDTTKKTSTGGTATAPDKDGKVDGKKRPAKLLQKSLVKTLASNIKTVVFGQDEVIDELVGVLKVATLNIKINKEKPAGCYFLAGPSGCGKTELAMQLAKFLGEDDCEIPFLKINMGEYGMENDVTKLIGAPPGYKGSDDGGLLTNFVRDNPISVILFDEVEKAHESMDKIMLSIMDHGTCADNKGRTVSFKDTIILSTSNLGAEVEYEQGYTKKEKDDYRMAMIKEGMRPEIINRYDSIFHCNSISKEIYEKILVKFLDKLTVSMKQEHSIDLKFSPKIIKWATETSYDPAMGGRPARKFIEKIIIKPIADQMIDDKFDGENNKEITMDINKDNNVVFKNKQRKVLGILENTTELVGKMEDAKFTKRISPK